MIRNLLWLLKRRRVYTATYIMTCDCGARGPTITTTTTRTAFRLRQQEPCWECGAPMEQLLGSKAHIGWFADGFGMEVKPAYAKVSPC